MGNPANYQRNGTEPIRSNQNVKRSTDLNPGLTKDGTPTGGRKVSEATTLRSSTLNGGLTASGAKSGGLSVYDATVKSGALNSGNGGNKDVWPAKLDSFDDAET